jgi:hypothetical protein
VGDRGDHEAPLALGGGRGDEGLLQPFGHPAQRVADLRDLAGAGGEGVDVQLAAGDAVGVRGQARERAQDPAAQEDQDGGEHARERDEAGAEGDRPAGSRALAGHPHLARQLRERDEGMAVALQTLLAVRCVEARRHDHRLAADGHLRLGRLRGRDVAGRDVGSDLGIGHRGAELGLDAELREPVGDPRAAGVVEERLPAQRVGRLG